MGDENNINDLTDGIIQPNHHFTLSLLKILQNEEKNIFFSPFSIQTVLMMVQLGAKGKTGEEIIEGLHLPNDRKKLFEELKVLIEEYAKHEKINFASEIFIENTYKVKAEFKNDVRAYFKSQSTQMDFKSNHESARQSINSWVEKETRGKIGNLLQPGVVSEDTRLVLVNAIHFKDAWQTEFKKELTAPAPFYLSSKETVDVPMMHVVKRFNYLETDTYQALQLPYKDGYFQLLILLPKDVGGLNAMQSELGVKEFGSILDEMRTVKVDVTLPKFRIEEYYELNDTLIKMGMETMFSEEADFSGIHEPMEMSLCVSKVVHKAFVEVNEEGTEAAAATGATMVLKRSLACPSSDPIRFVADHPFLFHIINDSTILFAGAVRNPLL